MLFAALSAASGAFASPAQAAGSTTATKDLFVGAHVGVGVGAGYPGWVGYNYYPYGGYPYGGYPYG
ncbi:hypothetical protein PGT21_022182 [Puccinia graminis f. sp. tritici]|uniref:Uncharacterized protein n=1 Tax=Puccinia graminis f. sp. tritici TaxID=56615 RepID=A0A5B0LWG6_PUCGR|nr:hypothetical protein PGT21_022182 [Puccinia graminis f. sp. tritici]